MPVLALLVSCAYASPGMSRPSSQVVLAEMIDFASSALRSIDVGT